VNNSVLVKYVYTPTV